MSKLEQDYHQKKKAFLKVKYKRQDLKNELIRSFEDLSGVNSNLRG